MYTVGEKECDGNHTHLQTLAWVCHEKSKENFPNPSKEEGREDQGWSEGYPEHIHPALAWGL